MADICNPSCNDDQIQMYAIPCRRQDSTRKGGFERFILLNCEETFTDITSISEWEAIKDVQGYIYSPPGFGTLVKPESKKEKLSACAPEEVIDEITGIEWQTKLFDNSTYLDFNFENDVKENYASKTLLWYGCDGLLYYDFTWVTGENPGFDGISADVYRESEPENLQKLHIDIKFNTYQKGLKAFAPSAALLAVIFDDAYISSGGTGI